MVVLIGGVSYLNQIISLYIVFSRNYLEKHFTTEVIAHRSEIEKKDLDDYININNFIKMHEQTKQRCIVNNSKFFEIEEDYEKEIKSVYDWIDKQVRIHFKARKL